TATGVSCKLKMTKTPPKKPEPGKDGTSKGKQNPTSSASPPPNATPNITQGPGSIAQVGENNHAMIINTSAPKRVLSSEQIDSLRGFLSAAPAKFMILYDQQFTESYDLASQIESVLKSAAWTDTQSGPSGMMPLSSGPPQTGIVVQYKGQNVAP